MDIVENGVFEFFANSFFGGVLRQQSARGNNVCEINKRTQGTISNGNKIYEDSTVEKKPLTMLCAQTHVRQLFKNVNILKQAGIKIVEYRADNGMVVSDYIEKPLLEDVILNALKEGTPMKFID